MIDYQSLISYKDMIFILVLIACAYISFKRGQTDGMNKTIDILVEKGIITEDEKDT